MSNGVVTAGKSSSSSAPSRAAAPPASKSSAPSPAGKKQPVSSSNETPHKVAGKSLSGRLITKRSSKQELPIPEAIKEKAEQQQQSGKTQIIATVTKSKSEVGKLAKTILSEEEKTATTAAASSGGERPRTPAQLRILNEAAEGNKAKSIDNLSTHVNVSSSSNCSSDSSPEPEKAEEGQQQQQQKRRQQQKEDLEDDLGESSSMRGSPVVSDSEDEKETKEFVAPPAATSTAAAAAAVMAQQQQQPQNRVISNLQQSRVNKRSESDGIVLSERPKPDRPVRRCESIDDATDVAGLPAAPKFPQNIKTVASATIVKGPEDATHSIGEMVHLSAHYFGNPEPRVTWFKNGTRIYASSERILIKTYSGESTLIIRDLRPDDSGKYEVLIENEVGNDAAVASLGVEGPPEPPAGRPFVSDIDNSSLTLAWYGSTFDGGSIVTGYLVEMSSWPITSDSKPPNATDWTCLTADCNSTSYIVKGLDSDREYIFRVKAQNVHGASEPSRVSEPVCFAATSGEEEDGEAQAKKKEQEEDSTEGGRRGEDGGETDPSFEAPFLHRIVNLEPGEIFKTKYDIYEELGRGRFGVVFKVQDKETKEHFAAKFIRCRKTEERQKVRDEIDIMNSLEHTRLLQLAAAYENPREIIMVMEYIGGGELFEKVVADDFALTERDCMLFMRQICGAIGYMHDKGIVHLDLKPENILCRSKSSHQIKVIDFGLTRKLKPGEDVRILFGTPEFVSPEVINYEPVTTTSDMWSVGVVCYVLLSGLSPFMGDSDVETFANISGIAYDFDDEAFDPISEDAKDFIRRLLIKNQKKRLSAQDCLMHHWLAQVETTSKKSFKELNTDKLKSFLMRRRWQKAAHAIRALGRFNALGFRHDAKDSASSISGVSAQSAAF